MNSHNNYLTSYLIYLCDGPTKAFENIMKIPKNCMVPYFNSFIIKYLIIITIPLYFNKPSPSPPITVNFPPASPPTSIMMLQHSSSSFLLLINQEPTSASNFHPVAPQNHRGRRITTCKPVDKKGHCCC